MFSFRRYAILIAIVAFAAAIMPQKASALDGTKAFGVEAGYVSKNKSLEFGIFFQYSFSEHFRVSPQADCVFRRNNLDAFVFDLDAHVPFEFSNKKVGLYPILGLNFSSWTRHHIPDEENNDVCTRKSRFGVNAGAGFDFMVSETMKLNLEMKYTMIKRFSNLSIALGVAYVF